jgi:hypothetical protein
LSHPKKKSRMVWYPGFRADEWLAWIPAALIVPNWTWNYGDWYCPPWAVCMVPHLPKYCPFVNRMYRVFQSSLQWLAIVICCEDSAYNQNMENHNICQARESQNCWESILWFILSESVDDGHYFSRPMMDLQQHSMICYFFIRHKSNY